MSFNLAARLAQQKEASLYRSPSCLESNQGTQIRIDGRTYLSFASNDYLGLANHPEVTHALAEGAQRWGVGGGASPLVTGYIHPHQQLEHALAHWVGRERALLFGSGYQANLAVLSALLSKQDWIVHDRLNHASLLDGGLLSGARFTRYQHNNIRSLEQRLQRTSGNTLVVTDGVFSMDGDLADLPSICALAKKHHAWVMVDDAHGLGTIGVQGTGTIAHYGLTQGDVPILMGTLGKALGTSGAFVAGSHELIESLIQFARPYIYSTSSSPAIAHATLTSLRLVQEETWRRTHLQALIHLFREGATSMGWQLLPSETAIQPLIVGDSQSALNMAARLRELGIWITAIRPPTVPAGSARLRITFSAAHSKADVLRLLEALQRLRQEYLP